MAESNGISKQLGENLIELVDKQTPSPEQRAEKVWTLLKLVASELNEDVTDYDVLCFAAEYLGKMSLIWTWLDEAAKSIEILVYKAHYQAEVWKKE